MDENIIEQQKEAVWQEAVKEDVLKGLNNSKAELGEDYMSYYFDNFILAFSKTPRNRRDDTRASGNWKKIYRDIYTENTPKIVTKDGKPIKILQSEIKLNQTPEQYYQTLDSTLEQILTPEQNLEAKKLIGLRDKLVETRERSVDGLDINGIKKRFYELMLPVYIKLRQMGYNDSDLKQ